MNQVLTIW